MAENKKAVKYWFTIFSGGGIIFTTIALIVQLYSSKRNLEQDYINITNYSSKINSFFELQLDNDFLDLGCKLDNQIVLKNLQGEAIKLGSINFKNYLLIYRISDKHCSICVEKGLDDLKKHTKQKKYNIAILGTYKTLRHLKFFQKKNNVNYDIFLLLDSLELHVEELNYPYYFIVDRDLNFISAFIPEKTLPLYTINYLKGIDHLIRK